MVIVLPRGAVVVNPAVASGRSLLAHPAEVNREFLIDVGPECARLACSMAPCRKAVATQNGSEDDVCNQTLRALSAPVPFMGCPHGWGAQA